MNGSRVNRLTKALLLTLVTVLLFCVCLLVVACKHEHNYVSEVTIEPTCTTVGEKTFRCTECDDFYTEELPKTEHDYLYVSKDGQHWQVCADCTATTTPEAHKFGSPEIILASTCTKQGSQKLSCACGATQTESLPLAEHSYTKIASDSEYHWTVCAECDNEKPHQTKTPHNLTETILDADCVKKGSKTTACADCNYMVTEEIDALGHDLDKTRFSSASTGSGHYYKCNRCNKDIAEPHQFVNCDCPEEDVGNRAPTCYRDGHQAGMCVICEKVYCLKIGKTDDHNLDTSVWVHNGTYHWHICTNGDDKYTCDYQGDKAQHEWFEQIVPATCTESGTRKMVCECGEVQSTKILPELGHNYVTIQTISEATCTSEGKVLQRCENCDEETETIVPKVKHVMSEYVSTINGHRNKCANCDFVQTYESNHTWNDVVVKEPTCTEAGSTKHTCKFCNYSYIETTTRNHDYRIVEGSTVAPTCKDEGHHTERCATCGDVKEVVEAKLTTHTVKEYPAKEMTETEPGNKHYWQCTVCGRYFNGHGCETEWFEEDIFTYPPKNNLVDSIADLVEIASQLASGVISVDYYQVTATVDKEEESDTLAIFDDTDMIYITLIERENVDTIEKNDVITLKGKLLRVGDDVVLVDCKVISVKCEVEGVHSLFITITDNSNQDLYAYVETYDVDLEEWYMPDTNNYNCIITGSTLRFTNYTYTAVLQKVIINGKSYSMTNRTLEITVGDEDIYAEFVFDTDNYCSVTLRELDTTNNNGNAIIADEYISYAYTNGGYNDLGHLHRYSHLTFTAENANITGINITYDVDWLDRENNSKALENEINVIRKSGVEVKYEQGDISGRGQIKVTIPLSEACTVLEYFANFHQAQVTEIIILYQTYNS